MSQTMTLVRADLCRKCGGEMNISEKCKQCRKPITLRCTECDHASNVQFHPLCIYG
ncbi:hypothetical protein [Candidatus Nitrosotenuis cloacae]|uniref:hypothetical protein n=1 Tax=Candidatus Nitrosotenuis cloacae TaxID=1603555 RepID=UPI00130E53FD|nr:hypothetical protein [Candidatus Nitrosotenuis cloacae]